MASFRMWSFDYVQVPNEETWENVRKGRALKLAEESEEDSPDDAELVGVILQRQASVSSLPISCGDNSEHEGPDNTSLPVPIQPKEGESPSLEQQQSTDPLQTSGGDSSLNGKFEMISESEVRESAIQQQQQRPKANVVAPFVSQQPGKKGNSRKKV